MTTFSGLQGSSIVSYEMMVSDSYVLRELAGKGVLMPERVTDPSLRTESGALRAIGLSASAFWLLKTFEGRDFTAEQAVAAVCSHYDVDRSTAEADVTALLDTLRSCGIIEE